MNTTTVMGTPIDESPQYGRTIYTVFSLLSMSLISTLFGTSRLHVICARLTFTAGLRLRSFGLHSLKTVRLMNPIRAIVASIYLCGMALIFCLGIMLGSTGLESFQMCRLGIYLCYLW